MNDDTKHTTDTITLGVYCSLTDNTVLVDAVFNALQTIPQLNIVLVGDLTKINRAIEHNIVRRTRLIARLSIVPLSEQEQAFGEGVDNLLNGSFVNKFIAHEVHGWLMVAPTSLSDLLSSTNEHDKSVTSSDLPQQGNFFAAVYHKSDRGCNVIFFPAPQQPFSQTEDLWHVLTIADEFMGTKGWADSASLGFFSCLDTPQNALIDEVANRVAKTPSAIDLNFVGKVDLSFVFEQAKHAMVCDWLSAKYILQLTRAGAMIAAERAVTVFFAHKNAKNSKKQRLELTCRVPVPVFDALWQLNTNALVLWCDCGADALMFTDNIKELFHGVDVGLQDKLTPVLKGE